MFVPNCEVLVCAALYPRIVANTSLWLLLYIYRSCAILKQLFLGPTARDTHRLRPRTTARRAGSAHRPCTPPQTQATASQPTPHQTATCRQGKHFTAALQSTLNYYVSSFL